MIRRIYKARNDNEFFEQIARIIFIAGFRHSLVMRKWPHIRKAFDKFSIKKVAAYKEKDVERLLKNKNIIRNKTKILAIIENAEICKDIQKEYGSVLRWIDYLKKERKKHPKNISLALEMQRFKRIGTVTSEWLEWLYESKKPYVEYKIRN